jgi:hypothetical protein
MLGIAVAGAGEISGYASVEARAFLHDALFDGQEDNNGSVAAQPEYYHQWDNGSSFIFVPFARVDSADSERTHWDIRELNYLYTEDFWFVRLGIGKVFWGASEFVHLVDIINQTDWVEHIDQEDKLGQPMLQFGISRGWGNFDLFILPYFRERTFPGRDGRLRPQRVIDTDEAFYEATSEERNVDMVFRYSRTLGDCDFGVYLFAGNNRDPLLVPSEMVPPDIIDPATFDEPVLVPFYDKITQFGTDLQWATGNWLWKLESYYRSGYFDDYIAAVGGFEYTFYGIGGGKTDLGLLSEYAYDERGDDLTTTSIYDNDVFLGMRLTPNDEAGTQLLMGLMQDVEGDENVVSVEASRRFGTNWKLILEAWFFLSAPSGSLLHGFQDDDFVRLELAYYF